MKLFFGILFLLSSHYALAKELILSNAKAEYTVKHLFKTVKGESSGLKGKMVCHQERCDFLVAIPVNSFISSDSNRDLNMQTILEASKYPLVTVKGQVLEADLIKKNFDVKSLVNFHGIEKSYILKISGGSPSSGKLVVLLEDHKIERPSLLMAKIENEVPIIFSFDWK